jgi:hypothetical protein
MQAYAVFGAANALHIARTNRIRPTHTLLTNLPVLSVYLKIHGDANTHTASRQLNSLIHWVRFTSATLKRTMARIVIIVPMIQSFQALGIWYDPYTQGDTNNHRLAKKTTLVADLLVLG